MRDTRSGFYGYKVNRRQTVRPGDWIIGNDNGVMVVSKGRAYELARLAIEVNKNEDYVRVAIDRWKMLAQVMDLYKWEKK